MDFQVHYLSVTVWCTAKEGEMVWDDYFREYLGKLTESKNHERGFKSCLKGILGKMKFDAHNGGKEYIAFELQGQACEVVPVKIMFLFLRTLSRNWKYRISRIDLAFDRPGFSVDDFYLALVDGNFKSRATRQSLTCVDSPFQLRDNGEVGCKTVYFGSRSSDRMVRCYNKHGFVRFEFEIKGKWAELVGQRIIENEPLNWGRFGLALINDFMEIHLSWWEEFIKGKYEIKLSAYTAHQISKEKLEKWISRQVAPGLSALVEANGWEWISDQLEEAKKRRDKKYDNIVMKDTRV